MISYICKKNILPLRNDFWIGIYIMCKFVLQDLKSNSQLGDRSTKCPAVFKGYSWLFLMIIIPMQKYVKLVSDSLFLHKNNQLTIICESETNFHREKTLSSA